MEEIARKPVIVIFWNHKNVTQEISKYVSSVTYTDNEEEYADDISLELDNSTGIWFEKWYPDEGDILKLYIGYQDKQFDTGTFEVDEIVLSGPPNRIEVKAISAGISKELRTRNNKAFEKQTLKQIAMYFAKKHGFTIVDDTNMLNQINVDRKTQENKTDMAFLSDIAKDYGFLFSIKGEKMVFTSYHALDNTDSVKSIDISQINNYSLKEKMYDTYASAEIKRLDRKSGRVIQAKEKIDYNIDERNYGTDKQVISADMAHVTSGSQARARVKGGLWNKNKYKQSGRISLPGDPTLVAGINFDLEGFGIGSGKYHITKSAHDVNDSGYITSIEIRKTGTIPAPRRVPATGRGRGSKSKESFDYNINEKNYGTGNKVISVDKNYDVSKYSKPLPDIEDMPEGFETLEDIGDLENIL